MEQRTLFRLLTDFKIYRNNPNMRKSFCRVSRFASLSQKNGFVFIDYTCHYKPLEPIFNQSEGLTYAFDKLQTEIIGNSNAKGKFLESSEVFLAFSKKWFCIRGKNLELMSNHSENSIYYFDRLQKKFIATTNLETKLLENLKICHAFPLK